MSENFFDLSDNVALVTGTSRGLGQYFARALARSGADLILTGRDRESFAAFEAEIQHLGRRTLASSWTSGITRASSVWPLKLKKPSARSTSSSTTPVATSVSLRSISRGMTGTSSLIPISAAASFVAQAIARNMIAHGYGRIINIGSVTSVFGYAGLGPYGASRGGIRQLTMSLADDWGRHGVTVNCLAPGWFKTEQNRVLYENQDWVDYLVDRIPVKRPGRPDDLDGAIIFLASEASRYITGQTLLIDGGISTGSTRATVQHQA